MKKFEYEKYKNCSFIVSNYLSEPKPIAFVIKNNEDNEIIAKCTTYDMFQDYSNGIVTIKNYSENRGMTEFLKNLGIVTEVVQSYKCNDLQETESIDVCKIDLKKLKAYSSEWYIQQQ